MFELIQFFVGLAIIYWMVQNFDLVWTVTGKVLTALLKLINKLGDKINDNMDNTPKL